MAVLTEERVREIVAAAFEVDAGELDADSNSDTVPGWDSLGHLKLILALEDELGTLIEAEDVVRMLSIREILTILEARYGKQA